MTTLPQTMSNRPRPAQSVNGVPAVASPMLAPAPFQPQASHQMSGADVWRVIRQNLWLFIIAVILSAAAGFGLNYYLAQHYKKYTAEAQVNVTPGRVFDPTGSMRTDEMGMPVELKTLVENQVQQLKSEQLLTAVVANPNSNTRQTQWMQNQAVVNGRFDPGRALEALKESFGAYAIEGSSLIHVTMEASDPAEAQRILEEIVNRRIDEVRQYNQTDSGEQLAAMRSLADDQQRQIRSLSKDVRDLGVSMSGDSTLDRMVLMPLSSQLSIQKSEAEASLSEAQSMLDNVRDQITRGIDPPQVDAMIEADPTLVYYRQKVDELTAMMEIHARRYGQSSDTMAQLEVQRDVWRTKLQEREHDQRANARNRLVSNLQSAVETAQKNVDQINVQLASISSEMKSIEQQMTERDLLVKEIEQRQTSLSELRRQINTMEVALRERPKQDLAWAWRPVQPTEPSFPKLPLTMGTCVVLGLGLAVGLAFLREVLDTSVKTPRDIARVGQMNLLGMIPDDSQDPEAGDPLELTIANAPHSMTAEQFRLVRSRLGHIAPLETTRTILVTSPSPGDGKTTVACNLAAGMALNGRRILLVDANFRRPGIHKVFGVSNDHGLSDALVDINLFDDYVTETNVPNLDVLPAGNRPGNPTELIEGTAFTDVVDRALEEYDHIIFDSGPILFVSETGALAPQCDGVVSVVRAKRSTRGLLGRLRDSLKSLNVEHLGVVLNGMKHHAGGYYNRNIKTYYAYHNGNGRR